MPLPPQNDTGRFPVTDPLNFDPLLVTAFRLMIPKLPSVAMFMQTISLPGLNVKRVTQDTRFVDIAQIGEKINYSPFSVEFLVQNNLNNYREIEAWMRRMTVGGAHVDEVDNIVLSINSVDTVRFYNCWPSELGDLNFAANPTDAEYHRCTVTFEYDYWEFI